MNNVSGSSPMAEAAPALAEAQTEQLEPALDEDESHEQALQALKIKQRANLEWIRDELIENGRKVEHWIWLVLPSDLKPGNELLVGANTTMGRLEQDVRAKIINNLEATILEGKTTLAVAKETLETVQTDLKIATPKLQKILDNLRDGTNQLDVRLNNLEAQVDKVVVEVVDLLQEGNKLVTDLRPETLESLKGLRRSVWEMEMALKKIRANPAVVLWGDDEKILSTWPTDPAKRRRSGRAAPYEQRDEDEKK